MRHSAIIALLAGLGGVSCSAHSMENVAEVAERRITGWGPFDFGMSFDEALVALPGLEWNPFAVRRCREDIAIEGCLLISGEERQLPLLDGIAFRPNLHFNRQGRLDEISLVYDRAANVTIDQCLVVLDQAVDGLAEAYGRLSAQPSSTTQQDRRDGFAEVRRHTSGGNEYTIGRRSSDGVYVSSVLRSHRPAQLSQNPRTAISDWEKVSHVWVLSSFIWVGRRPDCSISVNYHLGSGIRSPRQHEVRQGW